MTVRELIRATDYNVYILSDDDTAPRVPAPGACAETNLLKGCAGIMDLQVLKIEIDPEKLAVFAVVPLPREIVRAIYKYNGRGVTA